MRGLTSPVRAPASSSEQCWAPSGDRDVLLLDQRLHRAQVGEGRVHRDVDAGHVVGLEPQAEVAHGVQRLDVVVVHLPVPADQRAARGSPLRARSGAWRRASMPGRCALALDEGQRRPAAGREVADLVGQARARRARWRCRRRRRPRTRALRPPPRPRSAVPAGEALVLEGAQRPVPQHGAGAGDHLGEGRRRCRGRCRGRSSRRAGRPRSP